MKSTAVICLCLGLFILTISAADLPHNDHQGDLLDDTLPINEDLNLNFDLNLFKTLAASTSKNVLISPLSVKLLLILLHDAASGNTKTELENVLHLPENATTLEIRESAKTIIDSITAENNNYDLLFGSRLYIRNDIRYRRIFGTTIKRFFHTEIHQLAVDKGTKPINDWVSELTKGKITEIVSNDDIHELALLLVNTLYFKGNWISQFPSKRTKHEDFYVTPTKKVNAEFMSQEGSFYYFNDNTVKASFLRIPYQGRKFAMYFVLPDNQNGLSELIPLLTPRFVQRTPWIVSKINMNVVIPKFKFELTSYFTEALQQMGLETLFSDKASLPGMGRGPNSLKKLTVSNVLQKTSIEVNEEGSVAAAATEFEIVNKFQPFNTEFVANHPFIFYIQDETTGAVIFMGKVENPLCEKDIIKEIEKPTEIVSPEPNEEVIILNPNIKPVETPIEKASEKPVETVTQEAIDKTPSEEPVASSSEEPTAEILPEKSNENAADETSSNLIIKTNKSAKKTENLLK